MKKTPIFKRFQPDWEKAIPIALRQAVHDAIIPSQAQNKIFL